jgi:hypothetical protein
LARAACVAALALGLQGSTCHAHFCSGDDCEDEEEEDSGRTELVLPPLRDPWGRPLTGPIPLLPGIANPGSS